MSEIANLKETFGYPHLARRPSLHPIRVRVQLFRLPLGDELTPVGNRVSQTGALLIVASVALLLIGNRWANYLTTPVPGLYLVDALFAAGSLLGLARISHLKSAPRWLWWLFGAMWAYVGIFLVPEYLFLPIADRYDALRDAAPFLYLSLAPFAALALMTLSGRTLVWIVRFSCLIAALVALLTWIGILHSFKSPLLGSQFAEIFGSRPDLLGAAIGIGVLAWGPWPASQLERSLLIQGALLLIGVAVIENRSGLLALLMTTAIAVFRDARRSRSLAVPIGAVILTAVGFAIQIGSLVPAVTSDADTVTAIPEATATAVPEATATASPESSQLQVWLQANVLKPGTTNARLSTWSDIVKGMTQDSTWLLGGSAGSDYMYELCTGIPIAPAFNLDGPKCAVDDHGPEPVVRDPHNWILNIALYHGVPGLIIFSAALALPAVRERQSPNAMLPVGGIIAYLTSGMTFLISAGYALIPMSFFVAWLLRNSLLRTPDPINMDDGPQVQSAL